MDLTDLTDLTYRQAEGRADAELVDSIQRQSSAEITARLGQGHWTHSTNPAAVQKSMRERGVFLIYSGEQAVASFTIGGNLPRFWPAYLWRVPQAEPQIVLGVFGLAVLPPLQRRGVGTWAMRQIEQIARERGCRFVRLDAYEQNSRSVAFYRKLGYDERGRLVVNGVPILCFETEVRYA